MKTKLKLYDVPVTGCWGSHYEKIWARTPKEAQEAVEPDYRNTNLSVGKGVLRTNKIIMEEARLERHQKNFSLVDCLLSIPVVKLDQPLPSLVSEIKPVEKIKENKNSVFHMEVSKGEKKIKCWGCGAPIVDKICHNKGCGVNKGVKNVRSK